jgi:hypothetical protein
MAEVLKLFESPGAKGNKQDAVNGATVTMVELMVQRKLLGGGITEGNLSSSTGTLMGLVRSLQICPPLGLIVSYRPASLVSYASTPHIKS